MQPRPEYVVPCDEPTKRTFLLASGLAYAGYPRFGRGCVTAVIPMHVGEPVVTYVPEAEIPESGPSGPELRAAVKAYDPRTEGVIVLIKPGSAWWGIFPLDQSVFSSAKARLN